MPTPCCLVRSRDCANEVVELEFRVAGLRSVFNLVNSVTACRPSPRNLPPRGRRTASRRRMAISSSRKQLEGCREMDADGPLYCRDRPSRCSWPKPGQHDHQTSSSSSRRSWRGAKCRRARIGMPFDLADPALFFCSRTGVGSFFWHGFRTRVALAFRCAAGVAVLFHFRGTLDSHIVGKLGRVLGALALIGASHRQPLPRARLSDGLQNAAPRSSRRRAYASSPGWACFGSRDKAAVPVRKNANLGGRRRDLRHPSPRVPLDRPADVWSSRSETHFIWHMLLFARAYLGIVMLVRLKLRERRPRRPRPCELRIFLDELESASFRASCPSAVRRVFWCGLRRVGHADLYQRRCRAHRRLFSLRRHHLAKALEARHLDLRHWPERRLEQSLASLSSPGVDDRPPWLKARERRPSPDKMPFGNQVAAFRDRRRLASSEADVRPSTSASVIDDDAFV